MSILVSHDAYFLDEVITDLIEYELGGKLHFWENLVDVNNVDSKSNTIFKGGGYFEFFEKRQIQLDRNADLKEKAAEKLSIERFCASVAWLLDKHSFGQILGMKFFTNISVRDNKTLNFDLMFITIELNGQHHRGCSDGPPWNAVLKG